MKVQMLYSRNTTIRMRIHKTCRNIMNNNIRTSMNEGTHFFIKIYNHTLFSKGLMLVVCER